MMKIASPAEEPADTSTAVASHHAALLDRVKKTQQELRRFVRLWTGLSAVLAILIAGGLLAYADYLWILDRSVRLACWTLVGTLTGVLILRRILFYRREWLNHQATALEIETAFPDLGQRVCTTLEYAEPKPNTMPAWPSLVRALTTETEERTYRLDFQQVIPWHRLRWPLGMAVCLFIFFLLALILWPAARLAAMRLFLVPVHYTQLRIEPGNQPVKFGNDVKIRAILSGRPVETVELLSRKAGSQSPWTVVSLGPDDPQRAPLIGTLETSLRKCREDIEYRVTADAVESEIYRLTVLHPLELKKIEAAIEPPAYTRKKTDTVTEGNFRASEGSAVRFRFELDRPAQNARLWLAPVAKRAGEKNLPPISLKTQGKSLTGAVACLREDLEYELQAEAGDGMKLEPKKFRITVQPDRKPTIRFDKPDYVIEALPTTEVTMQVSAKDDFGLTKVGIVYRIGEGPWETLKLDKAPEQPVSLTRLATLYLEEYKLNFQDGLVYYAIAEDNYPSGPHQVASEMQFIDIRAYKREFQAGRPGRPGKSVSLELLISRQRTNLQHAFALCGEAKPDVRIMRRLAKTERSLAKMTEEFAAAIAMRFGPIPCLGKAIDAMHAAAAELDRKNISQACRQEELALANLIQARENLRTLLANPKSGAESERLDYQAQKNMPESPKDDEQQQEEEKPDENLQKQIADLAKAEREMAEEIDGKSGGNSSNPSPPENSSQQSASESQSQSNGQSQSSRQSPSNRPSQGKKQSTGESGGLAERQQQAVEQAAKIAKAMEADEAMTELAQERMANAERAIRSSAQSLAQGDRSHAGREAKNAAEQLERLARQVAALKTSELAAKLQASENLARQIAQQQHEAEKNAEKNESKGQGQGGEEGQGESGEGGDSTDSQAAAERQRAVAEEVRSIEDILEESQSDAVLADEEILHTLEEATATQSPKEIAARMDQAAEALSSGQRDRAVREIRISAQRLEALADQLEAARRGFEQPKLQSLMAAEKQAAELLKQLSSAIPGRQRNDVEKMMIDLRGTMTALSGKEGSLQEETAHLAQAIEGGSSGPGVWRQTRQGYYTPPTLYPSAVERVARALQLRIQELILKDAILDRDQPVPEPYRRHVEEYYRTLSEDLR